MKYLAGFVLLFTFSCFASQASGPDKPSKKEVKSNKEQKQGQHKTKRTCPNRPGCICN